MIGWFLQELIITIIRYSVLNYQEPEVFPTISEISPEVFPTRITNQNYSF